MPRYQFTQDDRRKGGKNRAALPDFRQHQQNAYYMLQLKKPGVAMYIYEQRIKPRYQRDGSPQD